jgi:hypothetical protein
VALEMARREGLCMGPCGVVVSMCELVVGVMVRKMRLSLVWCVLCYRIVMCSSAFCGLMKESL